MISDRGTFSVGHLARLYAEGYHAICSAPWGEFRPLFDQHRKQLRWKEASYLSVEQKRRREAGSELHLRNAMNWPSCDTNWSMTTVAKRFPVA